MPLNLHYYAASSSRYRTPFRQVLRRPAWHRPFRRSFRRGIRQIVPSCGPELRAACVALEKALKIAESTFQHLDPGWRQNRFTTPYSREEADRRVEEDLKRAYGPEAIARRRAAQAEAQSPNAPAGKSPERPAENVHPPTQNPTPIVGAPPPQKPDVIQAPLPRLPEGFSSALHSPSNPLESLLFKLFSR